MRAFILFISSLLFFISYPGHCQGGPDWEWAQQKGIGGQGIAVDAQGNSYVAAIFSGTVSFGSVTLTTWGLNDISLAKYDPQGKLLWVQQAGGTDNDGIFAVAVDAIGNAYVTGGFSSATTRFGAISLAKRGAVSNHSNLFVAKYSAQGTALWARTFAGGSYDDSDGTSIAVDQQGNVYAAGGFEFYLNLDGHPQIIAPSGYLSAFLIKLDAQGTVQWGRSAGNTGNVLANRGYVSVAPNGAIYFAGATTVANNSRDALQAFLKCFDAAGREQWAHVWGNPAASAITSGVTADAQSNAVLTASFDGLVALGNGQVLSGNYPSSFVIQCDSQGSVGWGRVLGTAGIAAIAADAHGNTYLAGTYHKNDRIGPFSLRMDSYEADLCVAKLDQLGQVVWVRTGGGSASSGATALASDANGHVYVTGWGMGRGHCGAAPDGASGLVLAKLRRDNFSLPPVLAEGSLQVYPNPAHAPSFDVVFPGAADGAGDLQLLSSMGQLVRTQTVYLGKGLVQTPFDCTGVPPGRYVLRLVQANTVHTGQLVLE
ncbi:T9SS type A sorting domain-containing protein [Hymenobacter agri]